MEIETINFLVEKCLGLGNVYRKHPLILNLLLEKYKIADRCFFLSEESLIFENLFKKNISELQEIESNLLYCVNERKQRRKLTGIQFAKEAEQKLKDNLKHWTEMLKKHKDDPIKSENAKNRIEQIHELLNANKERQQIEKDKEKNKK